MAEYNSIERRKAAARERAARQVARSAPAPTYIAPFVASPAPAPRDPRLVAGEQQPRAVVRRAIASVLASEYNGNRAAATAALEHAKRAQALTAELAAHEAAKPWAISPRLEAWRERRDALREALRAERECLGGEAPAAHAKRATAYLARLEAHAKARSAQLFRDGVADPAVAARLAELEAEEAERKRRQAVAAQLRADQADPKAARERQEARWAALREAAGPSPAEPNKRRFKPR